MLPDGPAKSQADKAYRLYTMPDFQECSAELQVASQFHDSPAQSAGQHLVLVRCNNAHMLQQFALGHGFAEIQAVPFQPDARRQRIVDQLVKRSGAPTTFKHLRHFCRRRADVATVCKIIWQVVGGLKVISAPLFLALK